MGMSRARHFLAGLVILVAGVALACAQATPPSAAQEPTSAASYGQQAGYPPPGQPQGRVASADDYAAPPAADVPGNLAEIDRAELALTMLLGPGNEVPALQHDRPVAEAPAATASPKQPALPMTQGDSCSIACAALASMKRSAEHLCGMTGDKDTVCDGAKARVHRAELRVTAVCPACGG